MSVRAACQSDLDAIVALSDEKRRRYEQHAPVFHRPAANACEVHRSWVAGMIADDDVAVLVSDNEDRVCRGFVIATLAQSPPVYDPGGATCSIDDFVVAVPSDWARVGRDLLRAAQEWGHERGAVQTVVVCGPHDGPKRRMLTECGLQVVSEWLTAPLRP